MALFHANHTLTQGSLHYRLATLGYRKRNTYGVEACILVYHFRYFMPLVCENRVMKCTMQCHRCYTFPYNVLLFHAVGWCKSGDEMYKSMSQL